ncbi:MAG: beta-N-acetylhexosaminidase [Fusobacteria bacterium]|nr:MAG: beta-N-acetylhexosaminidase [Fusobacteriota bacterium]KAF0228536.1 MAG: hypothetical protein FD182_792 [Fusobacteriota bacterium]
MTKKHLKKRGNSIGRKLLPIILLATIVISLFIIFKPNDDITIKKENKEKPTQEEIQEMKIAEEIKMLIESMTIEEKVAQLFIITPDVLTNGVEETVAGIGTQEALIKYPVGGLIYFTKNLIAPEQTKTMINNTKEFNSQSNQIPLFFSVDEEGGVVSRIANNNNFEVTKFKNLNQFETIQEAYMLGDTIGAYLKDLGFNLNYAPVADVYTNSANKVVKERAFSSDPMLVADMVVEEMRGFKEHNIILSLKHFPGHGNTTHDTHFGFAMTKKTLAELEESELIPFKKGIDAGAGMVMMAHISVPNIIGDNTPASLSFFMINEVLRNQQGFKGVVITDSLSMGAISQNFSSDKAAILAIQGGADILLMPKDFHTAYIGILNAVTNGEISETRIDESITRILYLKKTSLQW